MRHIYLVGREKLEQDIFDRVIEKLEYSEREEGWRLLMKMIRYCNFSNRESIDLGALIERMDEEDINRRDKNGINLILSCYYVIRGRREINRNIIHIIRKEGVKLRRYNNREIRYKRTDSEPYSMIYIMIKMRRYEIVEEYFKRMIKEGIDYTREFYDIIEEIVNIEEYKYIEEEIRGRVSMMSIKRKESIEDIPIWIRKIVIQSWMELGEIIINMPAWVEEVIIERSGYGRIEEEEMEKMREIYKESGKELRYFGEEEGDERFKLKSVDKEEGVDDNRKREEERGRGRRG